MRKQDILKGRYSTYQIFEPVGEGGSATVYRGVDRHTNTPVAIKEMIAFDEEMVQQWRVEVEMLMKLNQDDTHEEYIIRYLDHIHSGKSMLLVEEFAPNGSLLRLLRQRQRTNTKFAEIEVAFYLHSIVSALAYIHSKKIIHRDLKAANVLLTLENNVKLSDFGLAVASPAVLRRVVGESATSFVSTSLTNVNKYSTMASNNLSLSNSTINTNNNSNSVSVSGTCNTTSNTHAEGPLGSVYWFAPEVAQGVSHSCASDIWALGCVALELLTGHPPFFHRPSINALYTIAHCTEPPLPSSPEAGSVVMLEEPISEHCMNFLKCCFAIQPAKRSSAAALVHHDWFVDIFMHMQLNSLLVKPSKARLNDKLTMNFTGNNNNSDTSTNLKTTSSLPSSTISKTNNAIVGVPSSRSAQSKEIKQTTNNNNNNKGITRTNKNSNTSNNSTTTTTTSTLMKNAPYESLSQWVENSLFMSSTELREKWLESDDVLVKIVAVLKSITAQESFSIIRSFAFAAERCLTEVHSVFLTKLGETNLWEYYTDLLTLCRLEHLSTIFYCCCVGQPVEVVNFAPSTPQALQFFLSQDDEIVLQKVFSGLKELYLTHCETIHKISDVQEVEKEEEEGKVTEEVIKTKAESKTEEKINNLNKSDINTKNIESETGNVKERHQRTALIRLAHDGGLLVLRNIIQEEIQSVSVYNRNNKNNSPTATMKASTEPRLTWKRIDTLIHICERAAKLSENNEAHEMILGVSHRPQTTTTKTSIKHNSNNNKSNSISGNIAVNKERVEVLPSLLWFMSLQEASRQHCTHALHLLLYIITCHTTNCNNTINNDTNLKICCDHDTDNHNDDDNDDSENVNVANAEQKSNKSASITDANNSALYSKTVNSTTPTQNNSSLPLFRSFIILAGEIIVQSLLMIAIDKETSVVDKVAIAHVLCRLQQTSPRAHTALLDRYTCIPLLAHFMRCLVKTTSNFEKHEEQESNLVEGETKEEYYKEEKELLVKVDGKSICNALSSILSLCSSEYSEIMVKECTGTLVFVQVLWEVLVWYAWQKVLKEKEEEKESVYLTLEQRLVHLLTLSTTQREQSFTVHDFLKVNEQLLLIRWLSNKIMDQSKYISTENVSGNSTDSNNGNDKSNDTNKRNIIEFQTLLSCLTMRSEIKHLR